MLPVLHIPSSLAPVSATGGPVNRLSELFDRFWNDDFFSPLAATPAAAGLSLWDDDDNLYVEVDVPGMAEKDIDVSIHNGTLLIRGERKYERKGAGYDTRTYGQFEQRVSLPNWARAESVQAKLASGVLSLTFPKGDEAKPRRIPLKAE